MRTLRDLVNELETEAKDALLAALIVGFKSDTKFVFSRDAEALKKLTQLVKDGGEPVGIWVFKKNKVFTCRPLAECENDVGIRTYLTSLAFQLKAQLVLDTLWKWQETSAKSRIVLGQPLNS